MQHPLLPAALSPVTLASGILALCLGGCTTVKEHHSPVEIRPAANREFKGWQRTDFHVGGLDTWVAPRATVDLEEIEFAVASTTPHGEHVVLMEFTPEGAERMRSLSNRRMSRPVVVLLDGRVIAAPVLMKPVEGSLVVNFGSDRKDEKAARELARAIDRPRKEPPGSPSRG